MICHFGKSQVDLFFHKGMGGIIDAAMIKKVEDVVHELAASNKEGIIGGPQNLK